MNPSMVAREAEKGRYSFDLKELRSEKTQNEKFLLEFTLKLNDFSN